MKKSLLFSLALFAAMSAYAQREYQDGVYAVVGQHGNKIDVSKRGSYYEQPQPIPQPQFSIEDNTCLINDFDEVREVESSVTKVLEIEHKTIDIFHLEGETKVNHHYIGRQSRPIYNRRVTTRETPRSYSGYTPVEQPNCYLPSANEWFFTFFLDSDMLKPCESELMQLINYAKNNPYAILYIDSYSDALSGSFEYNKNLSEQRAKTIINILLNEGISYSRLRVKNNGCVNQPFSNKGYNNNLNRCVTVKASNF